MTTRRILKNKTELLGAIYNAETLPTAIFINKTKGCSPSPSTAHGFRAGNESALDNFLEGIEDHGNSGQEFEVFMYPFWEEPSGIHGETDHAAHWASNGQEYPVIRDCEDYATKSFADCA